MGVSLTDYRRSICWLLLLCLGHLPVPCFDVDWEDRGVPFESVFDIHAWHPMLLGVLPPDDIDRGPFREDANDDSSSPFGPAFVGSTAVTVATLDCCRVRAASPNPVALSAWTSVAARTARLTCRSVRAEVLRLPRALRTRLSLILV